MSTINSVAETSSASAAEKPQATVAGKTTVDYDAFLKLLVAQLKYQDPTDPTDPGEFMSQLASFSSVEQQIQANDKLDALLLSDKLGQASSLIGKTVTSADGNQSGVVKSVTMESGNLKAFFENEKSIIITEGVKIS